MTDICPICNEGFLEEHIDEKDNIIVEYNICTYCGFKSESPIQSERNRKRRLYGKKYFGNE